MDLVKPSRFLSPLCCSRSPTHNLVKELNGTVFTLNSQQTQASPRQTEPKSRLIQIHSYQTLTLIDKSVLFKNKRCGKKCTTRQQMCEQAKKRVKGNNTVQKLAPLCAASSPSRVLRAPGFAASWPSLSGRPARLHLHALLHLHLHPHHHRTRRTPAHVSSPRGIVTYGNAEDGDPGYYQMCGVNSSMRTDDLVVAPA